MNQATKNAVAIIAALPKKEREQALTLTRVTGNIFNSLLIRKSFPISEHGSYQKDRTAVQEILALMGVEFSGGEGGRGNVKYASLKKI